MCAAAVAARKLCDASLRPIAALAIILASGCSQTSHDTVQSKSGYLVGAPYRINGVWYAPAEDYSYSRVGIASYYGGEQRGINFHGRRTANGERYDMNALTAAHPTLPIPSLVRVTNLGNGRSVVLRINDRGPFIRGREIDVSRRAAQLLGFEQSGIARVRVEILAEESRLLKEAILRGDRAPNTTHGSQGVAAGETPRLRVDAKERVAAN
ncbi:MAG TPA: septal ring lytic transglycosylase RlpA family protein [Actinomycetota bacterium]|nr:septal ring lytic transglycosylase RlpA family protein [Actinomycetota bacterium]